MSRAIFATVALTASALAVVSAQSRRDADTNNWCSNFNDSRGSYCETRDDTIAGVAALDVDATPNGGISIRGTDQGIVTLHTRIAAYAESDAAARALADQVRVTTVNGRVRAEGPARDDRQMWVASFELDVPRNTQLQLSAKNGGIAIADFTGDAHFQTINGGIMLRNVGGEIRGQTNNGGVTVRLDGQTWDGTGLDVSTRNGGLMLSVPASYSAQLDVATVRGGVINDFAADQSRRRHIETTLGAGGPRLHLSTVNGGVKITRR